MKMTSRLSKRKFGSLWEWVRKFLMKGCSIGSLCTDFWRQKLRHSSANFSALICQALLANESGLESSLLVLAEAKGLMLNLGFLKEGLTTVTAGAFVTVLIADFWAFLSIFRQYFCVSCCWFSCLRNSSNKVAAAVAVKWGRLQSKTVWEKMTKWNLWKQFEVVWWKIVR